MNSFFRSLFLFFIINVCINTASAELENQLDSPDGLYSVSSGGVSKIHSTKYEAEYKRYQIDFYVARTHSVHGRIFFKGERSGTGVWYPATQQFHVALYAKPSTYTNGRCDQWLQDFHWSFTYKRDLKYGKNHEVWRASSEYPAHRKPSVPCKDVGIRRRTCEIVICNKAPEFPKPRNYIVRDFDLAKRLYKQQFGK